MNESSENSFFVPTHNENGFTYIQSEKHKNQVEVIRPKKKEQTKENILNSEQTMDVIFTDGNNVRSPQKKLNFKNPEQQ